MPIDLYPNIAKVKRGGVYQNLPGFVPQSPESDLEAMIASSESSTTAQYPHEEGSYFILNNVLYKADVDIAVNDIIAVGTNCSVAVLGDDLSNFINQIYDIPVDTDNLVDECVTPVKTSFMTLHHGENQFDISTMTIENKWYTSFTVGNKANLRNLDANFHDIYIAFRIPLYQAENFVMSVIATSNANIFKAALVDSNDIVLAKVADSVTALKTGIFVTNVPVNTVAIVGTIQYWKSELVDKNTSMMVAYGNTIKDYTPYIAPWWDAPNKKADEAYTLSHTLEETKRSVMYISKETNDTALLLKFLEAFDKGNTDVYLEKSTYTLSEAYIYMWNTLLWRWGGGLPVGNGCKYFFNDSTIISNIPSNPPSGYSNGERSVIDCRVRGTNYEIHDVTLINNGGRYCVHDEGNNSTTPYIHKYENVIMIYNHTSDTPDTGAKAFGAGGGFDTSLVFDGCVFIQNEQNSVRFALHAPTTNPNNDPCKLHLIMKNCYFDEGNIYINVYDGDRDTIDFYLFDNSFTVAFSDPIVNLIENNNTIRT